MDAPSPSPPNHSASTSTFDLLRTTETPADAGPDSGHTSPRVQGGSSTSSRRPSVVPTQERGETWMDFLRGTGSEGGASRRNSAAGFGGMRTLSEASETVMAAERKRRLTAPESPGRRPSGYRRGGEGAATAPGSSASRAIDLTASPLGSQNADPAGMNAEAEGEARDCDIVIPPWQPDSEVSSCPVCGTAFSFWYRKHHCRKCGRVVCANCSPHRITIPRQYIVHPPDEVRMPRGATMDLTGDNDEDLPIQSDIYTNPALGGGEEVRVCNPCVPDPNFSPPPRQSSTASFTTSSLPFPDFETSDPRHDASSFPFTNFQSPNRQRNLTYDSAQAHGQRGLAPQSPQHRPSLSDVSQRTTSLPPGGHTHPFSNRRVSFQNSTIYPQPPSFGSRSTQVTSPFPLYAPRLSSVYSGISHPSRSSRASSISNAQQHTRHRSLLDVTSPDSVSESFASSGLRVPPQPQPRLRREIPEEDECPICHEELPPKGPDGSTVAREAHVEECIASHFAGPPAPSRASPPVAVDAAVSASAARPSDADGAAASSAPSTGGERVQAEGSRRRRATHGMLRYRATEKDCVDERGEPQECVICFEEFSEGDEMGRLECFCKFHRTCIRQWWDTKGDGSCPTHQGSFVLG